MHRRLSAPDIDFDAIRTELGLSEDYGDEALAEAQAPVDRHAADREDRLDLALVTIDPPGSADLDQAVHITADADGYVIDYAIADVAALVEPEGALDQESRRRGTTMYFPDRSVPLHPRPLSEGAGSLLPEEIRPAVLWTIRIDHDGSPVDVAVRRARVRSVARLDYAGVWADAQAGGLHPSIAALPVVGGLRAELALQRGAVELDLPDQDVIDDRGRWTVGLAPRTPADTWNSHLSLLTGMCAGQIMTDAGIGLLRTLPAADPEAVETLRETARVLGAQWPSEWSVGRFLASLPTQQPSTLGLMSAATGLMRGAGYLAFETGERGLIDMRNGEPVEPRHMGHGAIAGVYAHVTAPLRRLGDRFAAEVCLSAQAGTPVPDWVRSALPTLPKILRSADAMASTADRHSVDLAESVVLADQVGRRFSAVVTRAATTKRPAQIFIEDPAIIAPCAGDPRPGTRVSVELVAADPATRTVEFAPVSAADG